MKTLWNASNYGNDLRLTRKDAELLSGSGDQSHNAQMVMQKPYVKKQLDALQPENLAKELNEYGAWDDDELKDHQENLMRWVWLSAGDIIEREYTK